MATRGSLSEGQLAHVVLETLHRVTRQIWTEVKGEAGELFPAQSYRILGVLAQRPYTLTELARTQAVRPATVSRAVRALSEQGWVTVERDPSDRRRVWIQLTPRGRQALRQLRAQATARLRRRLRPLHPEERALLAQAMALLQRTLGPAGSSPQPELQEAHRPRCPTP
ncbi:MAG: MarR family transcriptional regulator [Thermoflexus sp.]|nr:MarR family transcriptional regulator [Thermoflexus sp.]